MKDPISEKCCKYFNICEFLIEYLLECSELFEVLTRLFKISFYFSGGKKKLWRKKTYSQHLKCIHNFYN